MAKRKGLVQKEDEYRELGIPLEIPVPSADELLARQLQEEETSDATKATRAHPKIWKSLASIPVEGTFDVQNDEDLARLLQQEEEDYVQSFKSSPMVVTDPSADVELIDPTPDLHALFLNFNEQYFFGLLTGVEVKWSPKMTLCAGVCSYDRGGFCSIRLSEPLLKLRPREDYINTLLHEMIHALLFITEDNRDHDGHGPGFLNHAKRINKAAGTNITVYHNFIDEVNHYRTHVWKCDGPCKDRPPFFGIVRRSMNRPPQPADRWWPEHQQSCGGMYHKIAEPEKKANEATGKDGGSVGKGKRRTGDGKEKTRDIMEFFKKGERDVGSKVEEGEGTKRRRKVGENLIDKMGREVQVQDADKILDMVVPKGNFIILDDTIRGSTPGDFVSSTNSSSVESKIESMVECPVCGKSVLGAEVNEHVDLCLWMAAEGGKESV